MAAVAVKKSPPAILSQHYYLSADLCKVLKIIAFHQEELYLAQSHSTSSSYIAATNASSSAAASTSTAAAAKSSNSTVDISKSLATSLKLKSENKIDPEPFTIVSTVTHSELETALSGLNSTTSSIRLKAFDTLKSATRTSRLHNFLPTLLLPMMDQIVKAMAFQIRSFFKTSSESDFCELSSKEKEEEEEKEAVHLLRSIDATLGNLLRWSTVVASNGNHNPPPLTVLHFRQLFKALLGDDESDNHKDHSSLKDCSPAVVTQLKLIAATLLTTADCNPSDLLMALLWETSQGLEKIKQTSSDCQMDFSSSINLYRRLDRLAEWLETAGEHLTEWRLRSMASNVAFGIEDAALNGFMAVLTEIDSCLSVFKDSTLQTYRDFRLLEALRQLLDRLTLFADATQNGEFFERVLYSSSDTAHASFALGSLSLRYIQQTLETVGDSAEHRCQEYHHHHQHHYLPNSRAAELIASFDSSAHPKLQARRQEELLACLQPLGQLNSLSLSTDTFYPLWCRDDLDDIDRSEGAKMGLKKAIWVLSSPTHKPKLVAAAFEYFSEDVSLVNSKDNQQNSAKQVDTLLQYVTLQLNAMVIRQHKDSSSSSAKVLASVAENPIFYSALRLVRALLPLPSLNEVSPGTFYHLATLLFALRAAIFGFAVNEAATEVADALFNEENGLQRTTRLGMIMKMMAAFGKSDWASLSKTPFSSTYTSKNAFKSISKGGGGSTTTAWHSSTTSVNEILYTKMRTDYCCHRNDEEVLNGENARQLPAIIRTHLERVTRECFWSMLLPLMLDDDNDGGQEKEKNEKQNQIDQLDVPLLFSLMEQYLEEFFTEDTIKKVCVDFFARLQQQQKSQQQNPNLSTSSALLLYSVFESPRGSSVQLLAHLLYLLIVGRVRDQWPLPTATADSTTGVLASMVQHFQRAIYSSGPEMLLSESASGVRACRHGVNVAHPPKKASKEAQQDYCTVLKPVTQDKLCDNLFDGLARLQELFAGLKKCVNDLEKKDKKEGCEMPPESITEELLPWRKKKALAAWKKSRRQQPKLQRELFIKQLGDLSAALCILEQSPKLVEGLGTTGGESTLAAYIAVLTEVVLLLGKVEGNQKSDDSCLLKKNMSIERDAEEKTKLQKAVEFADRLLVKLLTISPSPSSSSFSSSSMAVKSILGTHGDAAHLTDLLSAVLCLRLKGLQKSHQVPATTTDRYFSYCLHSEKLAAFTRSLLEQCQPSVALHVLCRLLRRYIQSRVLFRDTAEQFRQFQLSYLHLLQEIVDVVLSVLFTHPTAALSKEEEEARLTLAAAEIKLTAPIVNVPSLFVDEPSLAHFLAVVERLMGVYRYSFLEQAGNYQLLEKVKRTIDLLVDRHGHHLADALHHWSSINFLEQVIAGNGKENDGLETNEKEEGTESRDLLKSYIDRRLLMRAQNPSPTPIHFAVPWNLASMERLPNEKKTVNISSALPADLKGKKSKENNADNDIVVDDDKEGDFNYDDDEEREDVPLYEEEDDKMDDENFEFI